MTRRVLLVDDDIAVREALGQTLELADLDALTAGSFVEAKDQITPDFEGIIVSDIRMPGRDGFHLLSYAREMDADLPVILLTGEGDIPMAVSAMGKGAFDFLEKPCAPKELIAVIERALKTRALVLENRRLKAQLETGDPAARMLFGTSGLAEDLRSRVRSVARTRAEVLVSGLPGVGISKVAEVVHLCSPLSKGPFGKHAAVGMDSTRFAEAAHNATGGSLFLDEITTMPMETQFALLALMEQGDHPRLIFGSTADLARAVEQGLLHADLFYRLDAMQVRIPSLAERPEDIPVLFRQYVAQAAEQSGIKPPEIHSELLADLMARDWPGNARALMSVAMRFVLGLQDGDAQEVATLGLAEQMAQVERSLLQEALRRAEGRASAAAKALKLPRKTFYDKLAKHGVKPEDFR
ncbi:sigma-54 dependent transcriptional regulator [Shimia thalassica]|uniref:sigma-54-dependent transcriptional regulator n=1 Tax=Shimia thalassica TaxID=1715693 RepID=UPI000C08A03A|nr:sigma-54 dependent transcriptional regulator [Shimia thalassica]PHO02355.1 sigma-54-dependent Fis family transcriptional regulator [Rhodobacteraceae bacterium 4F10]MDO6480309.1 sigma-54 dependent transcriptional regulator [Shimia thalassica]MDO6483370.1 sigma-54 dependent transcriptional regulator [Shimia thalassica]MDO6798547.1 sigma-54 dependent transcriptional regulator [Shimia thalassica]MDP2517577.1 sigma-54 dependent transcriptional regulator [Shimia thalassica]